MDLFSNDDKYRSTANAFRMLSHFEEHLKKELVIIITQHLDKKNIEWKKDAGSKMSGWNLDGKPIN